MSESKHTPETALALAGVAIFDRGIGWQADATATLKALAAEVKRLRAENAEMQRQWRASAVSNGGLMDALDAERRKVEALREALRMLYARSADRRRRDERAPHRLPVLVRRSVCGGDEAGPGAAR